jgi:hypothetical protein
MPSQKCKTLLKKKKKKKYLKQKKPGDMAHTVEHLPNKRKALSSNSDTTKRKTKVIGIFSFRYLKIFLIF